MTTEKLKRRKSTDDLKREAKVLVTAQDYSTAELARSLAVGKKQVRRWRQKFETASQNR